MARIKRIERRKRERGGSERKRGDEGGGRESGGIERSTYRSTGRAKAGKRNSKLHRARENCVPVDNIEPGLITQGRAKG